MELTVAALPDATGSVVAGGLIGVLIQGAVFIMVAWLRSRGRIMEAQIEAEDSAAARLEKALMQRLESCESQLANCQELLRVRTEEGERFKRHALNCDRQLVEMRGEISVLQATVKRLLSAA